MSKHVLLADRNCGMNIQAAELLARMSSEIIEVPSGTCIATKPYCKCREMGFVLQFWLPSGEYENIAFYEHRNSDDICAIRWTGRTQITGAITTDGIPEPVFPDKWCVTKRWECGNYHDPIEYVREVVAELRSKLEKSAA